MADIFDKDKRSEIMSKVKSSGNKSTELKLLQYFKDNKITGWRRNSKLFGKPDVVFPKNKVAVFVDGCFWHGHDCRNTRPSDNAEYWTKKISKNKDRDVAVTDHLKKLGYTVIRLWECEIKKNIVEEKIKF